jgi:trk system potassium uptake protein TrkH
MKFRLISRVLGIGLIAFSFLQLTPIIASIIYNEDNISAFAYSFLITLSFGLFLYLVNFEKKYEGIRVKEGFLLTVLLWLFFTIFATLPFILETKVICL